MDPNKIYDSRQETFQFKRLIELTEPLVVVGLWLDVVKRFENNLL